MVRNETCRPCCFTYCYCMLQVCCIICGVSTPTVVADTYGTTLGVLRDFKQAITLDPLHSLDSWELNNNSSNKAASPWCSWTGIVCSSSKNHGSLHITSILLSNRLLQGSITPSLALLPRLSLLDLSSNNLSGSLPRQLFLPPSLSQLLLGSNHLSGSLPPSLSYLSRLHTLNLSYNSLSASLPAELPPSLHSLDLAYNSLSGYLPASLSNLTLLSYLALDQNQLQGQLPPSLANCSRLHHFSLYSNSFSGTIPSSLALAWRNLSFLSLGLNYFRGAVPSAIWSLSKLRYVHLGSNRFVGQVLNDLTTNSSSLLFLDLSNNSFSGRVPPDLGSTLPKLQIFKLILNSGLNSGFFGSIPTSLANCSGLTQLILGFNRLSGTIPKEIFQLQKMVQLDLQHNALTGSIPPEIGNLTLLTELLVNNNQLTDSLPSQLGKLATLWLVVSEFNRFTGTIPQELGNCTALIVLTSFRNRLHGSIPSSFGHLAKLEHLILDNNLLTGPIPASLLHNCTRLTNISFNGNLLEGEILSPANLPNMLYFDVASNRLSGHISPDFGVMFQLQVFDLSLNNLSGGIPPALARCIGLRSLNVSWNKLEGTIPPSLGTELRSLIALNLSYNSFSGDIPVQLGNLTALDKLDLSFNAFTGTIPVSLADITGLSFANFSYNKLEGPVPDRGFFRNLTAASFLGNSGLCGQILHIPCSQHDTVLSNPAKIGLVVAGCLLLLILGISCFFLIKKRGLDRTPIPLQRLNKFSNFLKLSVKDIREATNDFSQENIIGSGGTGVVYKGTTREGKVFAFKKLIVRESSAHRAFNAELRSVGLMRHRNLVKVLGYCSDLDSYILIIEYMPHGSLNDHLHPERQAVGLPWKIRMRVAIGIAQGLVYLHYDCPEPVIHCDLKPSNILLDANMEARITDFGLAKVVMHTVSMASSENMRGSLGYMAPEYASTGQISRKCDVYSYGIILLELVSGRRPTAGSGFGEGETLRGWIRSSMRDEEDLMGILDERLREDLELQHHESIKLLLNVAMMCTGDDPKQRPTMQQVLQLLEGADALYKRSSGLQELIAESGGKWQRYHGPAACSSDS